MVFIRTPIKNGRPLQGGHFFLSPEKIRTDWRASGLPALQSGRQQCVFFGADTELAVEAAGAGVAGLAATAGFGAAGFLATAGFFAAAGFAAVWLGSPQVLPQQA